MRRKARRPRRQNKLRPKVVEVVNLPARQRARPRRRGRNKQGNGILGTLARGAMSLLGKGVASLVTGFGDYKVGENSLMVGGLDPPAIVNSVSAGGVIVRHREYLQDIVASTAFEILQFPLNPGLIETFPWLSSIAAHFEQYRWRGILFEFKSLSSDAVLSTATSSALGSVVMATQYNALNPVFPNKFVMENYEFANSSKPSISFIHPVECAKRDTSIEELYVRTGAPAANADLRLYDLGNFSIATVGMQADGGVAGELWVTYEIEFFKPKIENPSDAEEAVGHYHLASTATPNNTNPFLGNVMDASSTLQGTLSGNAYHFPLSVTQGRYIVMWVLIGAGTSLTFPPQTLTNCVVSTLFNANASDRLTNTSTSAAVYFDMACVDVVGTPAIVQYTGGVGPTTPSSGDFFVIEVPGNLTNIKLGKEECLTIEGDDGMYGKNDPYQDDDQYFSMICHQMRERFERLKINKSL